MSLTDRELADLYSKWSEDTYCAGWLSDGEEEFVNWLLGGEDKPEPLQSYELESIMKIRLLLVRRIGEAGL